MLVCFGFEIDVLVAKKIYNEERDFGMRNEEFLERWMETLVDWIYIKNI